MKLNTRLLFIASLFCLGVATIACNSSSADTQQESTGPATRPSLGDLTAHYLEKDAFAAGMKKSGSVLVDVRMPQEFEQGHLEGAINIDFFNPQFKYNLLELNKKKAYYIYDKNENRSTMTMKFMLDNDFKEVYVLKGGYEKWNTPSAE